ncbi:hypothetical protein [Mucilaginibacter xinganensis]|uniref:Uncharacterized protein n=1 Tax=Mucilaginibacter xinganensis TaxID=1234841 RepID=A0A223P3J4_9SPHI|nr:hypothetical protein [Mucilaginibacter xinganensis]ASU36652.1 hypothetical protein MuYL_4769 [Mucilaginibacter xinganensis]
MNKLTSLFLAVLAFCVFFCQNVCAQVALGDSSSQQNALNNAVNLFKTSLGNQQAIYTGPEYYFYDPHIKGNAYFKEVNGFTKGSIYYDGSLYNNISMLYDLNIDQVVILLPSHVSKFSVIKERVKSFDFLGNHFVNINADSVSNNTILKSGYYNQLYNGKCEVLGKYSKSIQTTTSSISGLENYFSLSKDYYIKKDNIYRSVGGQGALLDILKDKKKELKKYIKTNNIVYRDNPEEAMVKIAAYYDQLSN